MLRLITVYVFSFAITCLYSCQAVKTAQPHIVFVLADDYGYNDVGYHGSEIKTPNLDALAAKGVKLENYYVQPTCSPTRGQFMSGRYQIHTGLEHGIIHGAQPNGLPLDNPTVADKLRQYGYTTHMVGKWHLGFYKREYLPIHRGFDTYFGFYTGSEDYFKHTRNWTSHGKYTPYLDLHDQDQPVFDETDNYSAHLFTSRAIEKVRNHDSSKPMFLYLAYQSVHSPLQVPKEYMEPYKHIKDYKRRVYAGMVAALDEGVGNLTRTLKETGMWDNTVFVFSTDNGGQPHAGGNNYPLRGLKGTLWEGGIHGVGFVTASNLKTAGTVSRALMHVSDWYPTFVGLAGGVCNDSKPLDGYDQWEAISQGVPGPRRQLLHNIDILREKQGKRMFNDTFDTRVRAALRKGDWKLLTGHTGEDDWIPPPDSGKLLFVPEKGKGHHHKNLWLFNITADPYEHNELSEQYPEVVREMLDILLAYNQTALPPHFPPYDPNCNPGLHGGIWGPWE